MFKIVYFFFIMSSLYSQMNTYKIMFNVIIAKFQSDVVSFGIGSMNYDNFIYIYNHLFLQIKKHSNFKNW